MHEYDWKSLWLHLQAPYGPHLPITTKTTLNFHTICQSLGTPFLKGNWMMCCKETHPLLFKCLMAFLRCIKMIGRAFDGIYVLLMVYTMSFLTKATIKFHAKYPILWTLSAQRYKMLCWKKRHPLVLACFKTSLKYMKMIERASISIIYQPSWSSPCHFCRKQLSILMKNIRFGAPSQHGKWNVLLQLGG